MLFFFFFKQKTAYEMRISDWSSDVCSSDLEVPVHLFVAEAVDRVRPAAEQQQIAIDVEQPGRHLVVVGDRRQPVSATYNLLANALKYSRAGANEVVRARPVAGSVDARVPRADERCRGPECASKYRLRGAAE